MRRAAVNPKKSASEINPETAEVLALTRLVSELMTIYDVETFTSAMLNGLRWILQCDAVSLWLYNPASYRYILTDLASIDYGTLPPEDREILTGLQVRSGEALVGSTASGGMIKQLDSANEYRQSFGTLGRRREAMFNRWRALLPTEFQVTALGFGMQGRPIGVVEVFSQQAIALLEHEHFHLYLHQMAILLQLVRQQNEARHQRRRLIALDAVVTAINSSADINELLDVALQVMIEVVGAISGAICLFAPNSRDLYLAASANTIPASELAILNSSQATAVFEDTVVYGEPMLKPISTSEPNESLLGRAVMPLLAGGTIVGILVLYGGYHELNVAIDWPSLVSVASQVGIAIANSQLYIETQSERNRLQAVIESIADGIAICNREGMLVLANQTAADMLGLSNIPTITPLPDDTVRDLHGEPVQAEQYPFARALAGEIFHDYRLIMLNANQRDAVLSFSGAPLHTSTLGTSSDASIDGAVIVFRDITEQRRLDEAKDEFLAVAAHELRSPLAAIKGYSDLMLRRELKRTEHGDPRDLKGQQTLNQQVNVLMYLVDNLLDVSRIDAGRFTLQREGVDLGNLVETIVQQTRQTALRHNILLQLQSQVIIHGDNIRLRQVITNLLNNAIRYSPLDTTIQVQVYRDEDFGYFMVDDEGPGIPVHQRDKLFERYFRVPGIRRTGSSTEGLGLGLYLCRQIVSLHDGTINVDTAPSGGARFIVALPLHQQRKTGFIEQESLDLTDFLK